MPAAYPISAVYYICLFYINRVMPILLTNTTMIIVWLFCMLNVTACPVYADTRGDIDGESGPAAQSAAVEMGSPPLSHDFLEPGALLRESYLPGLDKLPVFASNLLPDTSFQSIKQLYSRTFHYGNGLLPGTRFISDDYTKAEGVFTFRGGLKRDVPVSGKISGIPETITRKWTHVTHYDTTETQYGMWGGGQGWTGQPLLVRWPDEMRHAFPSLQKDFVKNNGLEVIAGSLSGHVYFLDFDTGTEVRPSIQTGNPVKGTPMLDPRLNGMLYVGDGVPHNELFGIRMIDLHRHEPVYFFSGHEDVKAYRRWGAFDSSPLLVGDYIYWPGENGVLYKFLLQDNVVRLVARMVYHVRGAQAAGIESSLAVYKNYGYFGDNHGGIMCVNLLTMEPVWYYNNKDDTDATIVLEVEDGVPYLYTGSEVDLQGEEGYCRFVKLNGMDGSLVWEQRIRAYRADHYGRELPGGMFATPLLGRKNASGLIFANIAHTDSEGKGELIAKNTTTGEIVFRTELQSYSWSSPVGLYNEEGDLYIFTGDSTGNVYIIEGRNGQVLLRKRAGRNFEASPVVFGNSIIIGSRGREIYRFDVE